MMAEQEGDLFLADATALACAPQPVVSFVFPSEVHWVSGAVNDSTCMVASGEESQKEEELAGGG